MNVCYACSKPLEKIECIGLRPLTEGELKEREKLWEEYNRILKCGSCGELCYHPYTFKDQPPQNGRGLCKNCGGIHRIRRPRNIRPLDIIVSNPIFRSVRFWTCSIHGFPPEMRNHEE